MKSIVEAPVIVWLCEMKVLENANYHPIWVIVTFLWLVKLGGKSSGKSTGGGGCQVSTGNDGWNSQFSEESRLLEKILKFVTHTVQSATKHPERHRMRLQIDLARGPVCWVAGSGWRWLRTSVLVERMLLVYSPVIDYWKWVGDWSWNWDWPWNRCWHG